MFDRWLIHELDIFPSYTNIKRFWSNFNVNLHIHTQQGVIAILKFSVAEEYNELEIILKEAMEQIPVKHLDDQVSSILAYVDTDMDNHVLKTLKYIDLV
jgi:hypothetical protein